MNRALGTKEIVRDIVRFVSQCVLCSKQFSNTPLILNSTFFRNKHSKQLLTERYIIYIYTDSKVTCINISVIFFYLIINDLQIAEVSRRFPIYEQIVLSEHSSKVIHNYSFLYKKNISALSSKHMD